MITNVLPRFYESQCNSGIVAMTCPSDGFIVSPLTGEKPQILRHSQVQHSMVARHLAGPSPIERYQNCF